MVSFALSDEQKMLVDAIRRYARTNLRPKAREAEETKEMPADLLEKGWELGYLQASVAEPYGGFGERSVVTGVLAAEELAWGDLGGALAVMTPALFVIPILLGGTEKQKRELIPPVIEAEWKPFTAALVEPSFDFDPDDLHCTALDSGDGYILSGEKWYVPYADQAKAMIVYARLEDKTQGFIVQAGQAGLQIGERQKVMGINALPLFQLRLNDVKVAKQDRLGEEAGHVFTPILDAFRVASAAMAVGLSQAALDYACDYAKEREVFGVKVAQKQAIAFMLAEMATEIEAIRLLTWEAAWKLDTARPDASHEAHLAFNGAVDMAMMVTDRAVQILGGHGYVRDHPVELWMRNGRGVAVLTGLSMV